MFDFGGMIRFRRCDVSHALAHATDREAVYDLQAYIRVTGIPGKVRYLCEACATGRISPRFQNRFRLGRPALDAPSSVPEATEVNAGQSVAHHNVSMFDFGIIGVFQTATGRWRFYMRGLSRSTSLQAMYRRFRKRD